MELKTAAEFEKMRQAGRILADFLKAVAAEVRPGVTTKKLDAFAEDFIRSRKAEPAFKGYYGFPATICASVNEEVVHGIPGSRVLRDGDIIGIDVGAKIDGYYADAARTFAVGKIDAASQKLIDVTREATRRGIAKAVAGNRIGDISWAVQEYAEANGFSVVRDYVGHGIGRNLHEEPQVPNAGKAGQGLKLVEGMALAIEPMLNSGSIEVEVLKDGWTVVTKDRKRSGHFENTVFVGKNQPEVVTE